MGKGDCATESASHLKKKMHPRMRLSFTAEKFLKSLHDSVGLTLQHRITYTLLVFAPHEFLFFFQ
jgi:hypothetical protein